MGTGHSDRFTIKAFSRYGVSDGAAENTATNRDNIRGPKTFETFNIWLAVCVIDDEFHKPREGITYSFKDGRRNNLPLVDEKLGLNWWIKKDDFWCTVYHTRIYGDKLGWELHYFCVAFFVVEGITENCPETDLEETNLGTWLCLPFPSYDTRDLGRVEELFWFRFFFNLSIYKLPISSDPFIDSVLFCGSDHLTAYLWSCDRRNVLNVMALNLILIDEVLGVSMETKWRLIMNPEDEENELKMTPL